jgi:pimeloyl-ACP methyl ester carboxylesterase
MKKTNLYSIISLLSFLIVLVSLTVIQVNDRHIADNQKIIFSVEADSERLKGTYYPGIINSGVVVLEGFGSDQFAVKNVISEFANLGLHVFAFDFSGQGKSKGTLLLDISRTDKLAKQVSAAKNKLIDLSGLDSSEIIFIGHSMGARLALQQTASDSDPVAGIIILGTQLNLDFNAQSSFFTGTNDSELEWVQDLSLNNPLTNILMISGTWDDVLPVNSALLLFQKLTNGSALPLIDPIRHLYFENPNGNRELYLIPRLFHNYEVYSPRVMKISKNWALEVFGLTDPNSDDVSISIMRIIFWFVGIISLFSAVISASLAFRDEPLEESEKPELEILNPKKYLWMKLVFWLPAFVIAAILCSIFIFIPIPIPVFNLIYVGFIGGYGILMLVLYRFGKMPGTEGKWKLSVKGFKLKELNLQRLLNGVLAGAIITLLSSFIARSGLWYIFPIGRIFWLFIFVIFTTLGFFVGIFEIKRIAKIKDNLGRNISLAILIGFVPFILVTIFFAALGSISGMLGSIYGLVILALTFSTGFLVERITKNNLLVALVQAFLLQLLILPQGGLFVIF